MYIYLIHYSIVLYRGFIGLGAHNGGHYEHFIKGEILSWKQYIMTTTSISQRVASKYLEINLERIHYRKFHYYFINKLYTVVP